VLALENREKLFYVAVAVVFVISAAAGRDLSDPAVFSEVVLPMMVILVVAVLGYILYRRGLLGELRLR
jgi:Mn2+/Fe2+ NRAMP family transporter